MDTVEMTAEEFLRLLNGWGESGSRLRIALRSPELELHAFCTVLTARDGHAAFWIGAERDKNAVDFSLSGCLFGFRDVPPDEAELPVGVEVESSVGAVRGDFMLLIMLLKV